MSTSEQPWRNVVFYKGNVYNPTLFFGTYDTWKHQYTTDQTSLNVLREQIREYEEGNDGQWEYYKKIVNPYELVYTQRKYTSFPESVCILHPLSRSYFKMIEMLTVSDFFKAMERETRLRTAHVCEGPGGFIEAILEEATKRTKPVTQMTAMTLRPNQPNVPGWKRAATFLRKSRQVRVTYGADNTGDITKIPNQDEFIGSVGDQKVHIFTSDGGFDFSTDYLSQERFVFPLLLSSTRLAFEVLADGGFFVMKFFDIYHKGTQDLIYYLSCFFQSWTLYKPATSRPCNPEQYFIGRGFKGATDDVKAQLKNWCAHGMLGFVQNSVYGGEYPAEFKEQLDHFQRTILLEQAHYLQQVFNVIREENDAHIQELLRKHEYMSYQWCRSFGVPIYPARARSIEASQSGQRGVFQQ
jgi:23S rRNA U2552 (ribose-2'-O)-methylase RlmE/FtsJ